jgi:hypothetical protein
LDLPGGSPGAPDIAQHQLSARMAGEAGEVELRLRHATRVSSRMELLGQLGAPLSLIIIFGLVRCGTGRPSPAPPGVRTFMQPDVRS